MDAPDPVLEPRKSRKGLWIAGLVSLALCGGALAYVFWFLKGAHGDDMLFVVGGRPVTRRDFTRFKAAVVVDDPSAGEAEALSRLVRGLVSAAILDHFSATITREAIEAEAAASEKVRGPETTALLRAAFDGDAEEFQIRYLLPALATKRLHDRYDTSPDAHESELIEAAALAAKPWDDAPTWTIEGDRVAGGPIKDAKVLLDGPLKDLADGAPSSVLDHPTGFYVFKVVERADKIVVAVRSVARRSYDEYFSLNAQFVNVAFLDRDLRKTFETQVPWAKKVKIVEPGEAKVPKTPIR